MLREWDGLVRRLNNARRLHEQATIQGEREAAAAAVERLQRALLVHGFFHEGHFYPQKNHPDVRLRPLRHPRPAPTIWQNVISRLIRLG